MVWVTRKQDTMWNDFLFQSSSLTALWRFPGFPRSSFWYEQLVQEGELQHWWNYTDRGNRKTDRISYPSATCPPQAPRGLTWQWEAGDWPLEPRHVSLPDRTWNLNSDLAENTIRLGYRQYCHRSAVLPAGCPNSVLRVAREIVASL